MNILAILKRANTDRILRRQVFVIGEKMDLSRKEIKESIKDSLSKGLKSRSIVEVKLDENYLPFNSEVTEYYI